MMKENINQKLTGEQCAALCYESLQSIESIIEKADMGEITFGQALGEIKKTIENIQYSEEE